MRAVGHDTSVSDIVSIGLTIDDDIAYIPERSGNTSSRDASVAEEPYS